MNKVKKKLEDTRRLIKDTKNKISSLDFDAHWYRRVFHAFGACFLIRAFENIGVVYFQKELQFHKTFGLTMAGTLTDIVLSIALVLIYKTVWAYVIARLTATVVNLGMSYLLCSYRPKFHFVPERARELWKFGKWLFFKRGIAREPILF